ncbi:Glutamyl-tRNA(Gln) amidotransferase subunit A [Zostera marina]|uniref:Glutamyl-tRNA(Gln) amidotransferase subunit A n=1 Tax=Zostera marina TaxID=29655 RepID=A0A0K9PYT9_ZOSMR|nr:Glutamyl-tRNA(Gln) amidotransferase subunit A [Zostera marina]
MPNKKRDEFTKITKSPLRIKYTGTEQRAGLLPSTFSPPLLPLSLSRPRSRNYSRLSMASVSTNLWVVLGLGLAGVILVAQKFRKVVKVDFGAFIGRLELLPPPQPTPPKAPHLLTDLAFTVSDVFDVVGLVTGFGNPDWARTHDAAIATATSVSAAVDGGATCVGKTVVDDMCFGISGENKHFGSPTNPAVQDRIAGGCSSGSAVSVASGLVDFALGIDTVGGVRVSASFCGVLGFRPSQGTISNVGVVPVSQSLDTVGWFAKDPNTLHRVGHILLQLPYIEVRQPRHIIIADDCFEYLKTTNQITQIVSKSAEKIFGRQFLNHIKIGDYLAPKIPSLKQFRNGQKSAEVKFSLLESLAIAMQFLYKYEFVTNHGEWIDTVKPSLDPIISAQLNGFSLEASSKHIQHCQNLKKEIRSALNALLKDDSVLVIPTVPGPPPKHGAKEIFSEDHQRRAHSLLAIASMSGCCQVTVPIGYHEKCPRSVSFIARNGADRFLLEVTKKFYESLQEQVQIIANKNPSSGTISKEESAETAKQKGNTAYKEKKWQKAISLYSEAIKLVENNATYYNNRAAAYLELGNYVQVESDCTTAISFDKKNIKAYLRRGTARETLGYWQDALDDFRHALVLEPTNKIASMAISRLSKLLT